MDEDAADAADDVGDVFDVDDLSSDVLCTVTGCGGS